MGRRSLAAHQARTLEHRVDEVLRAGAVSFQYPQNQQGFGLFSLSVRPGESVLISGLSGSGKSTLARCLTGIIPHLYRGRFHGEVWLDGLRTDRTPLWRLSEKAGFVFQNPALQMITPTVEEEILFGLENLGLSRTVMRERLEEALAVFGLASMRLRSPQSLSGGEQQKLALAAALARKPPVLVLDEPLSMLDTTSSLALVGHLCDQIDAGLSTILLEHREAYLRAIPGLRIEKLGEPAGPELPALGSQPDEPRPEQTLKIEHLRVMRGGREILKDLSVDLHSGQIVALVGPNGAGKTTFLRALAGFQSYLGQISLAQGGESPRFGMVFQNPDVQLFNATVREEILYQVAQPDMPWYQWLMAMLDLQRYEQMPPLLLSEGEKRRVALATVLMRRPGSGILLDEPALGLDHVHKAVLLHLLRALANQGMFVIFSTHDLELAAQADHLILLGGGELAAQGSPRQVMVDDRAWKEIGLVRPTWLELPA